MNRITYGGRGRTIFLLVAAAVFFRPLVSGMGVDIFGPRAFANAAMRMVPLGLLIYAALRGMEICAPAGVGVALYFIAALLSSATGLNHFLSFERSMTLLGGPALMICVATWGRDETGRRELAQILLASAGLVALYGIYQYFWGFDRAIEFVSLKGAGKMDSVHVRKALEQKRIFSTTFSPDMLAGYLATMLPVAIGYIWQSRRGLSRAICGLLVVMLLTALYMTGSLGGLLAAGAGVAVWIWTAMSLKNRRKMVFASIAVGLCVLLLAVGLLIRRADTILNLKHPENPIAQRLMFWEGGLRAAGERPFTGVGPGNFGIAYLAHKRTTAEKTKYAHNHLIQALVETGPAGLAGFLWLAACFIIGGWRRARDGTQEGNKNNYFEAGLFAGGVALLAHGFIDFDFQAPEVAGPFWVIAGLSAAGVVHVPKSRGYLGRAGIFVAAAFFMLLNILWLPGAVYLQNGRAEAKEGDNNLAKWSFTKAIAWRPGDPHPYLERVKTYAPGPFKLKFQRQDMRKAAALSKYDPFLWAELGKFLFEHKDFEGAMEAFGEAGARFPTYKVFEGWERLANAKILVKQKNYAKARDELHAVLKEFPGHPAAEQGLREIEKLENRFKK